MLINCELSRQFLEKSSDIKFNENPSIGSRKIACGQTDGQMDVTKLIIGFRKM
jgi:hypothetical protein